jgi:hypothetical protein
MITFLLIFIISVFVSNNISNEQRILSTLCAHGMTERELIMPLIIIPAITAFSGSLIGTMGGILSIESGTIKNAGYFSYPDITSVIHLYYILFGLFVPVVTVIIVSFITVMRKFKSLPLLMFRKPSAGRNLYISKIGFNVDFRVKIYVREIRANFSIALGVLLC